MIKSKKVETLDKSNVRLSVVLEASAGNAAYSSLLKEYSQKAQIKGFRPGKVPPSILEQKFGESIRVEAAHKLLEDSLKVVFEEIEEKPLPYAQPALENQDLSLVPGEELSYQVVFDVFPKVEVKEWTGLSVEEPQVSIGKTEIDHELAQLQDQNAIVADIEGPAADKDILTISYVELDDTGAEQAGTARQDYVCTLGQDNNYYHIDMELVGCTKGSSKEINKTYPADFTEAELAGRTVRLKVEVSRIRRKDLPAIDDELAQDIDEKYKTLEDLKKDIKDRLVKTAESRVRQVKLNSLMQQIVEKNPIVLPESMVNAELYQKYEQMVRQFGGREEMVQQLLQAQGSSVQNLLEQWRPAAQKEIAHQLISSELIRREKIEASDAEVEAELQRQADVSKTSVEETRKYFIENNAMDYLKNNIKERKFYDLLLEKSQVKKGGKVKYLDLMADSH